ncbi:peroxiredoxin [Chitinibacter sp. GC72]|uniref:peroxiredoxin n=1 Tax=Chitinibacter sp. GC72 TaxID=1526917 RepID=UPI0012FB9841|nr:peroxiredoxin [Chitinibacter sp. GC72]
MSSALCTALQQPTTNAGHFDLSQLATPYAVIYFYPKDNTPGCTTESADFRDQHARFLAAGASVFGVSRDSMKSHENFKAKLGLEFELISDPEETACEAFGVMKLKNMYGKQVRGIERSTFVINKSGEILREWRGVKVPNHVAEVLGFVESLQ